MSRKISIMPRPYPFMHVKLFRPTILSSFRAHAPSNRNSSSFTGLTSEQFMKILQMSLFWITGRVALSEKHLKKLLSNCPKSYVPLRIGDEKIKHNLEHKQLIPSDLSNHVARFTYATEEDIRHAIEVGLSRTRRHYAACCRLVRLKISNEVECCYYAWAGKNIVQAEIDAACELIDFLRFNSHFALQLEKYEPISPKNTKNRLIYRGLEGFVAAIAPFNFTAIGGNLASAPALMGNVVMWKPSDTAVLSNYIIYQILEEAGMPPGVLSFLPSDAAINFTGSVPTFKYLWNRVANNLDRYSTFPRLVGECGGKNFHFVHPSADVETYQGQKCSACSRMYVPESLWPSVKKNLSELAEQIKVGDPRDGSIFMSAVIDAKSFSRIKEYINYAKEGHDGAKLVFGGGCEDSLGYFVQPTCVEVRHPGSKLLTHEIFGPVLTVLVYKDSEADNLIHTIKDATPYGLTGAVFSEDKDFLYKARDILRDAVGNLYLNDKSTGSVVGQQPFGGARLSGTNDKAGGPHYCLKWSSPQTIKETRIAKESLVFVYNSV
uniref:Aldehyde dehydrogenase domain-containing protein n=1 Tax=Ditylenchus dipsaci TaxID=166011 RepID=A0A915EGD6_9BILA